MLKHLLVQTVENSSVEQHLSLRMTQPIQLHVLLGARVEPADQTIHDIRYIRKRNDLMKLTFQRIGFLPSVLLQLFLHILVLRLILNSPSTPHPQSIDQQLGGLLHVLKVVSLRPQRVERLLRFLVRVSCACYSLHDSRKRVYSLMTQLDPILLLSFLETVSEVVSGCLFFLFPFFPAITILFRAIMDRVS